MDIYQTAVENVASFIRSQSAAARDSGEALTAFEASVVLAIAFDKTKGEVLMDLIGLGRKPK